MCLKRADERRGSPQVERLHQANDGMPLPADLGPGLDPNPDRLAETQVRT
jgi:hypothetical protein